jgi:hypothetical protein
MTMKPGEIKRSTRGRKETVYISIGTWHDTRGKQHFTVPGFPRAHTTVSDPKIEDNPRDP